MWENSITLFCLLLCVRIRDGEVNYEGERRDSSTRDSVLELQEYPSTVNRNLSERRLLKTKPCSGSIGLPEHFDMYCTIQKRCYGRQGGELTRSTPCTVLFFFLRVYIPFLLSQRTANIDYSFTVTWLLSSNHSLYLFLCDIYQHLHTPVVGAEL